MQHTHGCEYMDMHVSLPPGIPAFARRFVQANAAPPPMFSLALPFSGSPKFPAFTSPDGKGAPPPDVPPPPPVTYPLGHLPRKVPPLPMPEMPPPQWPYG